jgi:hypothetical protein
VAGCPAGVGVVALIPVARRQSRVQRKRGSLGNSRTRRSVRRGRVGQHQDVEQLGAASGTEGIEPFTELPLYLVQVHGMGS